MIVSVENISKSYGALKVSNNIALSLKAGEALGIIGPNGAGKTTLFNLIAGTILPDQGIIKFNGQEITTMPARKRCILGIARSFQIPQPFIGLTVFENILTGAVFGSDLSEKAAAEQAVDALILTGLKQKANFLASSLTLLERKRLEMARALATKPKLLLLDEIAGGLTEPECVELITAIKTIRQSGVSIIWIEHVVHALTAVVDRIAVIDFGQKIAEGDPHTVMASSEVREIYMGLDPEEEPSDEQEEKHV